MKAKPPLEIRWHGRGGQGVVTASRILATAALKGGYYIQSLPDFGAERSGAPIAAHTRVSETPPVDRGPITNPDVVILLDSSLIGQIDILAGLDPEGVVVANIPASASASSVELDLAEGQELWSADASGIGNELLGRNLPNTPILGAFARAVPVLDIETIASALQELMSETFNDSIIQANLVALKRGFEEVKQAEVGAHA